jgi:hypothetical protein
MSYGYSIDGWNVNQREAFLPSGSGQSVVEGHHFQGRGSPFGGNEGGSQLQRVGGAQGMDT